MNRIQKIAWCFVASTSAAFAISLAAVGIAYHYVGIPQALLGFSFMGLAGLDGLAPLLIKKDKGTVVADERDRLFQRRAATVGFATAYLVSGVASMVPFFLLGPDAMIRITWLPMIFMGAGICHYFMYAVMILNQYGWTSKGDRP